MKIKRWELWKKVLSILVVGLLSSSITPSVSNTFINNNLKSTSTMNNWIWSNIKINDSVATQSSGTHTREHTQTDTNAKTNSWTNFSAYKQVNANGYFAFHTYDSAKYEN